MAEVAATADAYGVADALESCTLGPEPEESVLKSGIVAISEAIGTEGLLNFPKRPNGTPVITRQGFFERLLRGEVSLQDCTSADAAAAEADVKRLALQQLLGIRCQHLEYIPTGAGQAPKASFLSLVDRCTMSLLAQRLLGDEAKALTEAHRTLVMRHVVLIYGAHRELRGGAQPFHGSDWWLLAVRGTRRYLHLPRCEVSCSEPGGPVCCYKSHTVPNPKDPHRSRVFRWQVLLLAEPGRWSEDPLAAEASKSSKLRAGVRLTNTTSAEVAAASGAKHEKASAVTTPASAPSLKPPPAADTTEAAAGADEEIVADVEGGGGGGFMLFGDFDVEELFDEFEADLGLVSPAGDSTSSTSPAAAVGADANSSKALGDDIDDFFDALLADDFLGSSGGGGASAAKTPAASAGASAESPSAAAAAPPVPAVPANGSSSKSVAATVQSSAGDGSTNGTSTASFSPPPRVDATSAAASPATAQSTGIDTAPPRDASEAKLRTELERFYRARKDGDKLGNVAKISQKYHGDGVVELWAQLGAKYSLPPPIAVQWLAGTLDPRTAVAWPRDSVPPSAQRSLDSLGDEADDHVINASLLAALEAGDVDAAKALAFCHGCSDSALRPRLWRTLILGPASGEGSDRHAEVLRERREAYRELRGRAEAETPPAGTSPAEVEAEVSAAWRGEAFLEQPQVMKAVANIVMTHVSRCSRYVRGTCEIAALLLFVMCGGGTQGTSLDDAEVDAFWCFSELMADLQDHLGEDVGVSAQARRLHGLLRAFDPPLASLLADLGLAALPALRLGAGLCTRAGFALANCATIWDAVLADPRRFEFGDFAIVALLLLNRGELLQQDNIGALAEKLIASPASVEMGSLIRTARSVCAFERRCQGNKVSFPARIPPSILDNDVFGGPKIENLDAAVAVAQTRLTSLWGKVSSVASEAWDVSKNAALEKAKEVDWAAAAARLQEAKTTAAEAASAAASSAATLATTAVEAYAAIQTKDTDPPADDWDGPDAIPEDEARELAASFSAKPESDIPPHKEPAPQPAPAAETYTSVIEEALKAPVPPRSATAAAPTLVEDPGAKPAPPALDEAESESLRRKLEEKRRLSEVHNGQDLIGERPASKSTKGDMPGAHPSMAEKLRLRRQRIDEAEAAEAEQKKAASADDAPPALVAAPTLVAAPSSQDDEGPPQLVAAPALVKLPS